MSHGLSCKNCGWREAFHSGDVGNDKGDPKRIYPGFEFSLNDCPGFQVIDEAKLEKAKKAEEKNKKEESPKRFRMFEDD